MTAPAMAAEFDDVAGWTAEAVEGLGPLGRRHAIPAACRGSASPAALAWLAEACELAAGTRLLDVGAGAGGPAAWAAERFGVRPVLLEPMPAACRAAARLFGLPVITADGRRIPLRTASMDAAWCLGVLCTLQDKAALLGEIHRVLKPGSSLGLLVVVARGPRTAPAPAGNHFPTQPELTALLRAAGFEPVERIEHPGGTPRSWSRRAEQVAAIVARRHRAHPAYALAAEQDARFARLFATGQISTRLIHAVSRPATVHVTHGGTMTTPTGDHEFLHEFETEVQAELSMAESSLPQEAAALPPSEWLYDPTDVERDEIGLRDLLGAAEALEEDPRSDGNT
ncbi:methyltransferase domain-containing protein [Spirillospora sp. NPDC029432]|uniref:class I SAM-dependent methyltransferase n=1 Tax=Spirillospora sp. NPDC029432 TaxID=3154599 RepID=UPI0034567034